MLEFAHNLIRYYTEKQRNLVLSYNNFIEEYDQRIKQATEEIGDKHTVAFVGNPDLIVKTAYVELENRFTFTKLEYEEVDFLVGETDQRKLCNIGTSVESFLALKTSEQAFWEMLYRLSDGFIVIIKDQEDIRRAQEVLAMVEQRNAAPRGQGEPRVDKPLLVVNCCNTASCNKYFNNNIKHFSSLSLAIQHIKTIKHQVITIQAICEQILNDLSHGRRAISLNQKFQVYWPTVFFEQGIHPYQLSNVTPEIDVIEEKDAILYNVYMPRYDIDVFDLRTLFIVYGLCASKSFLICFPTPRKTEEPYIKYCEGAVSICFKKLNITEDACSGVR